MLFQLQLITLTYYEKCYEIYNLPLSTIHLFCNIKSKRPHKRVFLNVCGPALMHIEKIDDTNN